LDFLKACLIYKSSPLLESTVATFTEKGVVIGDLSLNAIGVNGIYRKEYFLEYNVDKPENITLSKNLLDRLGEIFKNDEKITITTDEKTLTLDGSSEQYKEDLLDIEHTPFPISMSMTDCGILPQKIAPIVQASLSIDELRSLPKSDHYIFLSDGKTLKVVIKNGGTYTKNITLKDNPKLGELKASFIGDYLQHITYNFTGEISLFIQKESIVIAQNTKTHALTYLLTSEDMEE
jgi:hypothetical protein